ncbi:MAG: hypothetical protein RR254_08330, partial [Muribaculaceae bacterium]
MKRVSLASLRHVLVLGVVSLIVSLPSTSSTANAGNKVKNESNTFATPKALKGMPIKATFLDEVSWDIPHQNWGVKE